MFPQKRSNSYRRTRWWKRQCVNKNSTTWSVSNFPGSFFKVELWYATHRYIHSLVIQKPTLWCGIRILIDGARALNTTTMRNEMRLPPKLYLVSIPFGGHTILPLICSKSFVPESLKNSYIPYTRPCLYRYTFPFWNTAPTYGLDHWKEREKKWQEFTPNLSSSAEAKRTFGII